jgi:diaminohydroxyphosphoribosylaminopyrimidine deaminase/5-amino-6-(5-phosphoribosylamino)uracil reductase
MVGCVIIDPDGCKVGEGYHLQPGQPHAEVNALANAGHGAAGATAYVTLEPCSHFGRTPPCVDALIGAGVKSVVVAMTDPDLRVSGRGIERLLSAGIQVRTGVLEDEAISLNRAYIHHRTTGMPWVTVKVAVTLDGKIATAGGDSKWITGPITRKWVHRQLRDRCDAILVGVNTVLSDDPELTTRLSSKNGRNPLRVIVDSHLRTPLDSKVVKQSEVDGKTIIACLAQFEQSRLREYVNRGVLAAPMQPDNNNRVDIVELLSWLGTSKDVAAVLVEGGAEIIGSLFERQLVNRYVSVIAPKIIGGKSAIGPIGGFALASTMKEAVVLEQWRARRCAADLVIDALL